MNSSATAKFFRGKANASVSEAETATRCERMASSASRCLSFAAAPTFAIMASLSFRYGDAPQAFCSPGLSESHVGGMIIMYALMALFHLKPWLGLVIDRNFVAEK
jgi:hypothetical protein